MTKRTADIDVCSSRYFKSDEGLAETDDDSYETMELCIESDGESEFSETEMSDIPLKYLVIVKYLTEVRKLFFEEARTRVINLSQMDDAIDSTIGVFRTKTIEKLLKEKKVPEIESFLLQEDFSFKVIFNKQKVLQHFSNTTIYDVAEEIFKNGQDNFIEFVQSFENLIDEEVKLNKKIAEDRKRILDTRLYFLTNVGKTLRRRRLFQKVQNQNKSNCITFIQILLLLINKFFA